ncbi:MAG: hypothetical protein PHQ92_09175, partial [Petrimonas sp.]|nr:hypothetical protein [Petrimonas sp.]
PILKAEATVDQLATAITVNKSALLFSFIRSNPNNPARKNSDNFFPFRHFLSGENQRVNQKH